MVGSSEKRCSPFVLILASIDDPEVQNPKGVARKDTCACDSLLTYFVLGRDFSDSIV